MTCKHCSKYQNVKKKERWHMYKIMHTLYISKDQTFKPPRISCLSLYKLNFYKADIRLHVCVGFLLLKN